HLLTDWETIAFSHTNQPDCLACHAAQTPRPHYAGACVSCHATETWRTAPFRHTAATTDCAACHQFQTPANHSYEGACADCHDSDAWQTVHFDHRRYRHCQDCH